MNRRILITFALATSVLAQTEARVSLRDLTGEAIKNNPEIVAAQKNFEAARHMVVPGKPQSSLLLTMPLAADAGGIAFHPGGKHWASQSDPEWQAVAAWVRGEK